MIAYLEQDLIGKYRNPNYRVFFHSLKTVQRRWNICKVLSDQAFFSEIWAKSVENFVMQLTVSV